MHFHVISMNSFRNSHHCSPTFLVPWKKQHPTNRDRIRALMMGMGKLLRSLTSEITPTRKTMDSRPSRSPVVKAKTKKACFLPKPTWCPAQKRNGVHNALQTFGRLDVDWLMWKLG